MKERIVYVLITVLFVGTGIVGGYYYQCNKSKTEIQNLESQKKDQIKALQKEIADLKEEKEILEQTTDGIEYINTQYGFSLTLPDTWKGYTVEETSEDSISVYRFKLPSEGDEIFEKGDHLIFLLSIYPKKTWFDLQWEGEPDPCYLREHDDYIFDYSIAQHSPSDFSQRLEEVKDVVWTLKFNK